MVFSSHLFVFYFLPLALLGYYLLPLRGKHIFLTFVSYVFYGWWEPWFVCLMMFTTVMDFMWGRVVTRPGATVVDVGTNHVADRTLAAHLLRNLPDRLAAFDRKGSVLIGDVDPSSVAEQAGAYSPVPGGVGPLTIAMLLRNTLAAASGAV